MHPDLGFVQGGEEIGPGPSMGRNPVATGIGLNNPCQPDQEVFRDVAHKIFSSDSGFRDIDSRFLDSFGRIGGAGSRRVARSGFGPEVRDAVGDPTGDEGKRRR
jgi:hypothetical protein